MKSSASIVGLPRAINISVSLQKETCPTAIPQHLSGLSAKERTAGNNFARVWIFKHTHLARGALLLRNEGCHERRDDPRCKLKAWYIWKLNPAYYFILWPNQNIRRFIGEEIVVKGSYPFTADKELYFICDNLGRYSFIFAPPNKWPKGPQITIHTVNHKGIANEQTGNLEGMLTRTPCWFSCEWRKRAPFLWWLPIFSSYSLSLPAGPLCYPLALPVPPCTPIISRCCTYQVKPHHTSGGKSTASSFGRVGPGSLAKVRTKVFLGEKARAMTSACGSVWRTWQVSTS